MLRVFRNCMCVCGGEGGQLLVKFRFWLIPLYPGQLDPEDKTNCLLYCSYLLTFRLHYETCAHTGDGSQGSGGGNSDVVCHIEAYI